MGFSIGVFLSISLSLSFSHYNVYTIFYLVGYMFRIPAWGFRDPTIPLKLAEFATLAHIGPFDQRDAVTSNPRLQSYGQHLHWQLWLKWLHPPKTKSNPSISRSNESGTLCLSQSRDRSRHRNVESLPECHSRFSALVHGSYKMFT
jgi:hypothetical protein